MLTRTRTRQVAPLRQTLGAVVVDRLREEINSGQLAPSAVVAEVPTAERFGVSRVPVLIIDAAGHMRLDHLWDIMRGRFTSFFRESRIHAQRQQV
jgi:hypothetical protein